MGEVSFCIVELGEQRDVFRPASAIQRSAEVPSPQIGCSEPLMLSHELPQ